LYFVSSSPMYDFFVSHLYKSLGKRNAYIPKIPINLEVTA